MNEVAMTLNDVTNYFGVEVAKECEFMKDGEIREFHIATYEAIVIRCEIGIWGATYYVKGEYVLEEALELDDGLEIDF